MDSTIRVPGKQAIKENYEKYRKLFSAIMDNIQKKISKDISLNPKPVYKSRIKSFDSYYSKLLRLKPKEASENDALVCLTDMMGIRIVCAFLEDISTVENQIRKKYAVKEVEHKGNLQNVKEFGYESTHILIEIPEDCKEVSSIKDEKIRNLPLPENLVCEIQVRTILQDAWAEVEHELIYKTEFTPFDAPLRRKMASVNASLNLADIIFQEIRDYQTKLQREVEERRMTFYEQADNITESANKDLNFKKEEHKDINRVSPFVHGTIDDMILAAIHAHNSGDIPEAIRIYTEILENENASDKTVLSVIHKHRGMAYFAQNDYEKALSDFKKSSKYDPKSFRSIYYEGIVYSVMGDTDSALKCFNRSLEINEFQSHALFRRALAYYNKNEYQKALNDLNAAESLGLSSDECKSLHKKLVEKFDMGL
ncbi:MAG: tetratricopeptide repeat protein [Treponema sp.]|uniref:tetratricopeptide repeat protein n=1 Tax=Treponema sp. TaxID=166 RepID=UPI001B44A1BB|nr:tetratricopeptide repeat protein [Treponema sp.]MBP5403123.1 tetratricopeptide repeat protein [Treponema sp.]MBR5934343.1 tetratricopeptide repeat protein [Treponema sp.]